MKILMVHPQMAQCGGAEVVIVRMATCLQNWGHEVDVMTLSTNEDWPEYKGINFILPMRQVPYRLRGLKRIPDILNMHATLKAMYIQYASRYDAVNVHNFPAIWSAQRNQRTVWLCNEVPDLWHSNGMSWVSRQVLSIGKKVDRFMVRGSLPTTVVPDARCAQRVWDRYSLHSHIIPYGIDSFMLKSKTPPEPFTILHPAMVSPSKQQLEVLEAVAHLQETRHIALHVIFSGYYEPDHPYSKILHQFIEEHNISAEFVGLSDRKVLQDLYSRAHVAVFPGKGQGSWLGPFEQVTVGNPIIVSPNLTCSTLVLSKSIGIVSFNLATAIREVYEHYREHQERTLQARLFVKQELTWANFTSQMLELMK